MVPAGNLDEFKILLDAFPSKRKDISYTHTHSGCTGRTDVFIQPTHYNCDSSYIHILKQNID